MIHPPNPPTTYTHIFLLGVEWEEQNRIAHTGTFHTGRGSLTSQRSAQARARCAEIEATVAELYRRDFCNSHP